MQCSWEMKQKASGKLESTRIASRTCEVRGHPRDLHGALVAEEPLLHIRHPGPGLTSGASVENYHLVTISIQ